MDAFDCRGSKPNLWSRTCVTPTSKLLAATQKTGANGLRFIKGKFDFEEAILLLVADASHAAETSINETRKEQRHKSQSGRFLLLAGSEPAGGIPAWCHVLEWAIADAEESCKLRHYAGFRSCSTSSNCPLLFEVPMHSWRPCGGTEDSGNGFEEGAVALTVEERPGRDRRSFGQSQPNFLTRCDLNQCRVQRRHTKG
eukprot:s1303_g5.t1